MNTDFDERTERNISTLLPKVQEIARVFLAKFNMELEPYGCVARIIEGTRTIKRQNELFNQPWDGIDNDEDGKVDERDEFVTRARGGESRHNFGLAFDVGIFDGTGHYIDDLAERGNGGWSQNRVDMLYKIGGPIARSMSLTWGGDFTRIVDYPHYEYNPRGLTLAQMRERVAQDKDLI